MVVIETWSITLSIRLGLNKIRKAISMFAKQAAMETGSLMPPHHILNAPTELMKEVGYGKGYVYDHDTAEGISGQSYFPDDMERRTFYRPFDCGYEQMLRERLAHWEEFRERVAAEASPSKEGKEK